jgi:hypothetical protein
MEIKDLFLKYQGGISEICGGKSETTAGFLSALRPSSAKF